MFNGTKLKGVLFCVIPTNIHLCAHPSIVIAIITFVVAIVRSGSIATSFVCFYRYRKGNIKFFLALVNFSGDGSGLYGYCPMLHIHHQVLHSKYNFLPENIVKLMAPRIQVAEGNYLLTPSLASSIKC